MAIIVDSGTCAHCGETITKRVYAAPYSANPEHRQYGIRLWVADNGQFPGDQKICESNILPDDIGSHGNHEPV